jgi:hypothetical protein
MNKYDNAKFLKGTKARIVHICDKCEKQIENGEIYYSESVGRINAPGIKLKKFCKDCFQKSASGFSRKKVWILFRRDSQFKNIKQVLKVGL